jgi:acyl carrier protein
MTDAEIRGKLIDIIKEEAKVSEEAFTQGQPLSSLVDSLTLLEIICRVEDDFGLEIEDDQIPQLKTFEDVVDGVAHLLAQKQAGA